MRRLREIIRLDRSKVKIRKPLPPPTRPMERKKYSRKTKHKGRDKP